MSRHNTYLIKSLSPCSRLISDVARRRLLFSLVNDILLLEFFESQPVLFLKLFLFFGLFSAWCFLKRLFL